MYPVTLLSLHFLINGTIELIQLVCKSPTPYLAIFFHNYLVLGIKSVQDGLHGPTKEGPNCHLRTVQPPIIYIHHHTWNRRYDFTIIHATIFWFYYCLDRQNTNFTGLPTCCCIRHTLHRVESQNQRFINNSDSRMEKWHNMWKIRIWIHVNFHNHIFFYPKSRYL